MAASWDDQGHLGCDTRYGIVLSLGDTTVKIKRVAADATYKLNPSGHRSWKQAKPFFTFAPDVVDRYMLAGIFANLFSEDVEITQSASRPAGRQ